MRSNAEIAKKLGFHFEIIHPYKNDYHDNRMRKLNPDRIHLAILDKKGRYVHRAWYRKPDDMQSFEFYEYVINHCVAIGAIQDWNGNVGIVKEMLGRMNFMRQEILDELA